jgi:Domain of unknown function (DUF4760)
MDNRDMETILAIATCLLVVVTIFLAYYTSGVFLATLKLANESREASIRQIGVQTWLEFSKRFDSKELLKARDDLALQVRIVPTHGKKLVSDILVSFFEDLGTVYRLGYIDEKLARDSFGYHVRRWWAVLEPYIEHERKIHNGNNTLFCDFEKLAATFNNGLDKITDEEIRTFLQDEKELL